MHWQDGISPPSKDEIEITVFGPGIGESIVIHCPGIGWGVIDCCISEKHSGKIVHPLAYLKALHVEELAFIALSHPHEDHYLGMNELLDYYNGRLQRVVYYMGDGVRELLTYQARQAIPGSYSLFRLVEVIKSIDQAEKNGATKRRLGEMTDIIPVTQVNIPDYPPFRVHIQALSPSAESIKQYVDLLRKHIPREGEILEKLPDKSHNLIASAIWCSVGDVKILLGSDVEKGSNDYTGWRGILRNMDRPSLAANIIKVAHHGSSSSFLAPAWTLHIQKGLPISIITPFTRSGRPLPNPNDVKRLTPLCKKLGLTSMIKVVNPKKVYAKPVQRAIERVSRSWEIIEEPESIGFIRVRMGIDGELRECANFSPAYFHS
jgi:hypothetical protein